MTTLALDRNVSEIAARSLAAVRVFERHNIDYCCGGRKPIAEACAESGLDSKQLLDELRDALAADPATGTDWAAAPLRELTRHIVEKHHVFLRQELPAIAERLDKVMRVYGEKDKEVLALLPTTFAGLHAELDLHMRKEEVILFPYIEQLESAVEAGRTSPPPPFGTVANPIGMMEQEHDDAGSALRTMRAATHDYEIPAHACVTYRALLNGLRELEEDLHLHIHLENNILFPRAVALELTARDQNR